LIPQEFPTHFPLRPKKTSASLLHTDRDAKDNRHATGVSPTEPAMGAPTSPLSTTAAAAVGLSGRRATVVLVFVGIGVSIVIVRFWRPLTIDACVLQPRAPKAVESPRWGDGSPRDIPHPSESAAVAEPIEVGLCDIVSRPWGWRKNSFTDSVEWCSSNAESLCPG